MFKRLKALFTTPKVTAVASPAGPSVVIVDHGCHIPLSQLQAVATALSIQANSQFGLPQPRGWGMGCTVRVGTSTNPPKANEWVMGLYPTPDMDGALGFHDETANGLPYMHIFPLLSSDPWSITASHELCEVLADSLICLASQSPYDGKFWALEVCDAVEADVYKINGVWVSNFVLPPYFEPPQNLRGVRLDWLGLIKTPFEVRPGGYMQWFDPNSGWQQVDNFMKTPVLSKAKKLRNEYRRATIRNKKFKSLKK